MLVVVVVSCSKSLLRVFDISLKIILAACIVTSLTRLTENSKFRIRSSLSSFQVEKVPNPVDLDEEGKDRSFLQELFFVDPDCLKSIRHLRCFCERDLIHINSVLILKL